MEKMKFKTNIKCAGCIAQATPFLNESVGRENWEVDIQNPEKILTIIADYSMSEEKVIQSVTAAGFKAEVIRPD